ncbi:DUF6476 family protein [Primorskyibacter sp. S87]|uniref:DUF6476 family protein n=1 Tax=Primorskyibacter sp. S87 TaxID=3415126 RepID=UPI003C7C0E66
MQTQPPAGEQPESPQLKFLRRLVTTLTAVMICGVVVIVGLLVLRLQATPTPLPDQIALPDGVEAQAFTIGPDWYAVVTKDNQILIFDQDDGTLRQSILIEKQSASH